MKVKQGPRNYRKTSTRTSCSHPGPGIRTAASRALLISKSITGKPTDDGAPFAQPPNKMETGGHVNPEIAVPG